ncbi:hypothetical protein RRG08_019535 [Elysia crispata]|uniref:Uncharacterized protein n=1 Tax=Elysia crispata TaxID=231223 RepID=A0AAE1D6K1_9GAST|nr:hypothetical protein RRG08_019535 [Elysia crispata]
MALGRKLMFPSNSLERYFREVDGWECNGTLITAPIEGKIEVKEECLQAIFYSLEHGDLHRENLDVFIMAQRLILSRSKQFHSKSSTASRTYSEELASIT